MAENADDKAAAAGKTAARPTPSAEPQSSGSETTGTASATVQGAQSTPTAAAPTEEERYDVAGWKERARLFKSEHGRVSSHAIAGALHAADEGATFTRQEVENALRFLHQPIAERSES